MAPKKIDPSKLLAKAKAKAKKDKQQLLVDPGIKPTLAPDFKKPPNPAQLKTERIYEEEIKVFFTQIKNTGIIEMKENPTVIVSVMFNSFARSHPTNYWPTKLIDRILTILDPNLYLDFATEYLGQTGIMITRKPNGQKETNKIPIYNLKDFFNFYVARPKIAAILRSYYEEINLNATEIDRLQKIADDVFPEKPEEITELVQFGPQEKPRWYKSKYNHTKFIDKYLLIDSETGQPIGGEVEVPKKPEKPKTSHKKHKKVITPPMAEINCKKIFLNSSWLGGIIYNVYIAPIIPTSITTLPLAQNWQELINDQARTYYYNEKTHKKQYQKPVVIPKFKDIDPTIRPYINSQQPATINDGVLWYIPNRLFFSLICNNYSSQRQEGDIFTALDLDSKMVSMKIGFETNKRFAILNEELFSKWRQYKQNILLGRQAKIQSLITEPFNPLLKEIGRVQLSTALHKIAPQVEQYGYTKEIENPNDPNDPITILNTETVFINTIIENITAKSLTNQNFIEYLAPIIRGLDDIRATLFHSRIIDIYYLPEILADISVEEIYPAELSQFLDSSTRNSNFAKIQAGIKLEFDHILDVLYKRIYYTERAPTLSKTEIVEKLPKGCLNPTDISEEKRIYYRSQYDDIVYCLNIDEIIRGLVLENTYINPVSKKVLDPGFIQQFKLLYYKELQDVGYKKPQIDISPINQDENQDLGPNELAPGLLDLLFSKLHDCKQEIEQSRLTSQGKCPSLDDETSEDETSDDGTTSDDETPDDGTTPDDETPDDETPDDGTTPDDGGDVNTANVLGTYNSKSSFPIPNDNICVKCNGKITKKNYKTIKEMDPTEYQTIQFCGPDCFEKYNKFTGKK